MDPGRLQAWYVRFTQKEIRSNKTLLKLRGIKELDGRGTCSGRR